MPQPFDGVFDPEEMTDDELYDLLMQEFQESQYVQADWIELGVRDGFVTLGGRVGTDLEVQAAERIVDDIVGVERYRNDLVIDELHRDLAPEAADDAVAEDRELDDPLGEPDPNQSDTAEHLVENLEEEQYGTHDVGSAIQDGTSYSPPDGPFPGGGYRSGENH